MSDETEEELLSKHRKERKNLQAQIQSLKKSCGKGDKKKKKELTDTITKIEQDLEDKHAKELEDLKNSSPGTAITENSDEECNGTNEELEESVNKDMLRLSKAQRRRIKKEAEDKEREERIRLQEEENKNGPRLLESEKINNVLKHVGLKIHTVPADGDCLYFSIKHQLLMTRRNSLSVQELRKMTSEYMKSHKDDIFPFMSHGNDEEIFTEEQYEQYCENVANTAEWGGHVELLALSNILKCPIKVIQADSLPTIQGDHFTGAPLVLTFHRHLYGLGEHYNSTVSF